MALKPTKPTVPPAPSRSNPGVDFSNKADTFAAFQTTFADYMDATAEFVDDRADAALAAALGGSLPPLTGQTGRFLRVASPTSVTFSPNLIQDANGNLGLGAVPQTWATGARGMRIGSFLTAWTQSNGAANVSFGAYEGSTTNVLNYSSTGDAPTLYRQLSGGHSWLTAPSGTAGNAISFTQAMTLDAAGNLGIGTTSPTARLQVEASGFVARFGSNTNAAAGIRLFRNGTNCGEIGSADALFVGGSSSEFGLTTPGANALLFGTSGTERARIAANGDITVSNPAQLAGHLNSALTFGVIGSYAFLYIATASAVSEGDVIAGSSLSPAGVFGGSAAAIAADGNQSAFVTRGAATMAGSWRSMGRIANASGTLNARIGLFLRIS